MKNKKDSWEIEFDKQFLTPEGFWNRDNNMYPFKVKSFIRSTLNSTLQSILEKVEKRKDRIDCTRPNCRTCDLARARNAGIDIIRQVINEEMK